MNDKITFSWDIHYACNYRCPYCWFYEKWASMARKNKVLSVEESMKYWKNIYDKYGSAHIEMLGGEPFMYPNFKELIKQLSMVHSVAITTNLSCKINDFIDEVDFNNLRIKPTFHPLFADFDDFLKNLSILKSKQKDISIFYLGYPPQIKLLKHFERKFLDHGVRLEALSFWGNYGGVQYPQGYTPEEKEILNPYMATRVGEKFQLEPKRVKGKLCKAGYTYADIRADGSVYRCGSAGSTLIGNAFTDDFNLLDSPMSCESDFCPCNEWIGLLVEEKNDGPERLQISSTIELKSGEIKKAIDRNSIPPHRGFLTWDIHYACNYNCTYCNTPKPWNPPGSWDRDRDKVAYPGVDKWLKIWEDIYIKYGSCEIHITGGEPFIYPSFIELITRLSQIHTLEIITNLASDVNDIVKNVTPDRVRIGTTFHPEFTDLKEFLDRHIVLREYGFETWANYVAYPPQLKEMADYKKEFDKLGIPFNIQPFMGNFQEREYPKGYTDSELSYLKGCYAGDDIVNKKTVEWKTGTEHKNTSNSPCRMGQMYAKIYPIGDAYRCCANNTMKLGNLIDGSFKLLDEALPCEADLCHCWRCMLVGKEEDWSRHWVIPAKKIKKPVV